MTLVEESCLASCVNDDKTALDKAKEASSKERTLIRHREQAGLIDSHNLELTFVVRPAAALRSRRAGAGPRHFCAGAPVYVHFGWLCDVRISGLKWRKIDDCVRGFTCMVVDPYNVPRVRSS